MNLETFFEKFDQFADAPDAVAKMRELVLQLAVQGKLVKQDQRDESAGEIIRKARQLTQADPRLAKVLKVYDDGRQGETSALAELPAGWAWTCNAELGDTSPRNDAHDDTVVAFAPMNRVPTDYRVTLECESRRWGEVKKGFTHFANGDVAVAKITPCFQNGKACVMANLTGGFGAGTTELHVLRPHPNTVVPLYVMLFFKSPEFVAGGVATFSGTAGQQRVSNDYFRFRPFPLPPLAEQKRIVAKVDELMALCDRLEAQQQERETRHAALARASLARFADAPTPANLPFLFHPSYAIPPADLHKSILTLAVQGKLVPQDAEPPFGSLETILAEASVNGVSKGPTFDKSATEILRISAGTSRSDFYVNEDDFKHVDLPPDEIEKFQLAPGDLLACRFNGNLHYVGRFSYYRGGSGRVQVNPDKLIRFRIKTEFHCPRYVCLAMNAAPTREAIEAMCATTAGNIGLSAGRLKTVEIPLPPLAEQRRIVANVEQLMALVDALETQLAASRATAANLLTALVAELTGTPNNGKASVPSSPTTGRRGRPPKS